MKKIQINTKTQIGIGNWKFVSGFTFIELIVVIGVMALLLAMGVANYTQSGHSSSLPNQVITVISDIKDQQLKAMVGADNSDEMNKQQGVFFDSDRYTLFRGSAYSPSESSNFVISLPSNMSFSTISLPGAQIVFATQSGEVANFVSGQDSVVLHNSANNEQKTVQMNKYGIVTSVN